jgi:hypothetical protein
MTMTFAGSLVPIFIFADASIAAIGIPTIPGPMTPIFLTFQFLELTSIGLFSKVNTKAHKVLNIFINELLKP